MKRGDRKRLIAANVLLNYNKIKEYETQGKGDIVGKEPIRIRDHNPLSVIWDGGNDMEAATFKKAFNKPMRDRKAESMQVSENEVQSFRSKAEQRYSRYRGRKPLILESQETDITRRPGSLREK